MLDPGSTRAPVDPGPGAPRAGATKFGLLELGRGVAAALVVFHQAGDVLTEPRFFGVEGFGGHLCNFNVGVDFFFVLSGFIIAWVHWRDIGDPDRLGRYVVRRFARIYPPYWCILFPLIVLYQMFPGTGAPSRHDIATALLSIPLLPDINPPVLGVGGALWLRGHRVAAPRLFLTVGITASAAALALFGAASYAVYLVHPEAISILAQMVSRLTPRSVPIEVAIIFVSVIAVAAGMAYHRIVEAPLTGWTRRILSARLPRGERAANLGVD